MNTWEENQGNAKTILYRTSEPVPDLSERPTLVVSLRLAKDEAGIQG